MYKSYEINKIYNESCINTFKRFPDEIIDLIVTDIPYPTINGGNNSKKSYKWNNSILSKNDGKIFNYNNISIKDYIPECYRILKKNADIYIMTNLLNLTEILNETQKYFKLHNLLIWEKNNAVTNRWYMKNIEYIVYLYKGKAKPINNMSSKSIQKYSNVQHKKHPTQKPVDLFSFYINNSSKENDLIYDPFCGIGTLAISCINLNRRFICSEIDKNYYKIALETIKNYKNSLKQKNLYEI